MQRVQIEGDIQNPKTNNIGASPRERLDMYVLKHVNLGIRGFIPEEIADLQQILTQEKLVALHPKVEYIQGVIQPALINRVALEARGDYNADR